MSRITLQDTLMDVLVKMAEGNPGAITAMMDILDKHDAIDPQAVMGGLGAIMLFDTLEIYGSSIYIIWNDKCGKDVRKLLVLQRSCQLGFMPDSKLKEMAADQMREVDLTDEEWDAYDKQVCDRLEDFAKAS